MFRFIWKRCQEIIMSRSVSKEQCGDCPALSQDQCLVQSFVKLSSYRPGDKGTVAQICGNPDFRLRMMEMGFTKGTEIKVVKYAPLNDPMEFVVKGYHLTLRRDQAADILMNQPEKAA